MALRRIEGASTQTERKVVSPIIRKHENSIFFAGLCSTMFNTIIRKGEGGGGGGGRKKRIEQLTYWHNAMSREQFWVNLTIEVKPLSTRV